jgi:hypothetical protein
MVNNASCNPGVVFDVLGHDVLDTSLPLIDGIFYVENKKNERLDFR